MEHRFALSRTESQHGVPEIPGPSGPVWIALEQLLVAVELTFRNGDLASMMIPADNL